MRRISNLIWPILATLIAAIMAVSKRWMLALAAGMKTVLEKPQRAGWWNFSRVARRRAGITLSTRWFTSDGRLRAVAGGAGGSATDIRELREKRMTLVNESRALHDAASAAARDLTADEQSKFDRIMGVDGDPNAAGISAEQRAARLGEIGKVDEAIGRAEKLLDAERRSAEDALRLREEGGGGSGPSGGDGGGGNGNGRTKLAEWSQKRTSEFRSFLNGGSSHDTKYAFQTLDLMELTPEERQAIEHDERDARRARAARTLAGGERRSLEADTDITGGYTVRPEQFIAQLIQNIDDAVFIRSLATVQTVTDADTLGAPSLDADPDDGDWTIELGTGGEDSAMRFGKRELRPHPIAKRIKVSKTLLRKSALPIENIVMARLAYKFGISEEKAFLTGDGVQKPLGVFTASADGIPTTRDVSTGNSTTAITFDGLKNVKYSLKAQYWPRLVWMYHRDAVKQLDLLKDGNGQYIWQPSVLPNVPDRLLSFPIRMSEYVPNTFTTGLYVGILGDFSNYWIADALSMELQRLVELYAETNQIGFILRKETDAMPVLSEAFARVKLA